MSSWDCPGLSNYTTIHWLLHSLPPTAVGIHIPMTIYGKIKFNFKNWVYSEKN
jgi:hypothetical protein